MLATLQTVLGKYSLRPYRLGMRESEYSSHKQIVQGVIGHKLEPVEGRAIVQLTDTENLDGIIKGSQHNLFSAGTIFPFKVFNDSIKIDRQKLTIVHNELLRSSQTASAQIQDIMNIQADAGPFFGSITITSKHFLNNTQTINFLKRKDVYKIQRLIQGFMIAHRVGIKMDHIDDRELLPMLLELGEANL